MPNPQSLVILTDLRKAAGLSLGDMARVCGLSGNQSHQTAGAWELGRMTPTVRRRALFIPYLWDTLALRRQPAQFEQVWELLVEEWDWAPLSDAEWQRLTSTPRSVVAQPQSTALRVAPFQVPALTPHFVGRQQLLADLRQQVLQPQLLARFALVGMGGVGKTTLAVHLAHELRGQFTDGVLWARVATTNPLDIAQSWAQAYGYDYSALSDVDSRAVALRGLLAEKQALLIFDDVVDAAVVRPLLPGSGSSVALLTTRDQDVAAALHAQRAPVAELSPQASLALLRLVLDVERVAAEPAAAQEICHALHHLPLAVEIAAQRLKVRERQQLSALAAQLRDITARLNLAIGDHAVRASFLASWEILETDLRHVFACCGRFAGRPFAAAALAYVAGLDVAVAEEALFSLVALSLLKEEAAGRYQQHPLLADFAREQLGDAPVADLRLAAYYLGFARHTQTNYGQLEPEWENIMAAMEAAYARQQWQVVIDYAETLTTPWFTRARYTQARQGYAWAVEGAKMQGNQHALASYLVKWGYACSEQGDQLRAEQLLRAGMTVAQQIGDRACLADAQFHLARFASEQGAYEGADQLLSACLELRQQLQDLNGIAAVYDKQADLFYRAGQLDRAEELCQAALQLQQAQNDIPGILSTLRLLSDIANAREHYQEAHRHALHSLALAQQHHLSSELAETYLTLAATARCLQDFQQAWIYAEQARQQFEHMGNQAFLAVTLYEESIILRRTERLTEALQKGQASLALLITLKDEFNYVYCVYQLGGIYHQLGQADEAERLWQTGHTLAQTLHHPYTEKLNQALQLLHTA